MDKKLVSAVVLGILLVVGLAGGWWFFLGGPGPTELPEDEQLAREKLKLYYLQREAGGLAEVERSLSEAKNKNDRIRQVVKQLTEKPDSGQLVTILPEDLKLRSVFLDSQTVYLDFNESLLGAASGTTEEMYLLYSIVNSVLANLPERYKLVHFMINGETRKTIGAYGEESGHIAIKYPLGPRWNLVESS